MKESKFYRMIHPLVPKPLRAFVLQRQELVSYLVFGVLTTLVNFVLYYPLSRVLHYLAANVIAWIGAVAFAFFTNKAYVFEDADWSARALARQGAAFAAARLASLGAEELLLWGFVEKFGVGADVTKVIAAVVVVVLNYVFSKLFVFRRSQSDI